MCGVAALYNPTLNKEDFDIFAKILRQSKIRGLHSFGQLSIDSDGAKLIKANNFEEIPFPSAPIHIFHARYSTSGDYKDHRNNQPLQVNNDFLAFNGVISMKTKAEMEQEYNVKLTSDNDGELMLRLGKDDPIKFLDAHPSASFAGVCWVNGLLIAFRNEKRPLWCAKNDQSVFIASTEDIFRRAAGQLLDPQLLASGHLYDLQTLI